LSEKCDLRVSLVSFKDHPPEATSYITMVHEFTTDISKIKEALSNTNASEGGDRPEAICCALNDCLGKLSWRDDAMKVLILITDAPPHGIGR
jgi:hypothetical protein